MPRFVRSYYLMASATGRRAAVSIGPKTRDGNLYALLTYRDANDKITEAVNIHCTERGVLLTVSKDAPITIRVDD